VVYYIEDVMFDMKQIVFSRKGAKQQVKISKLHCALAPLREMNFSLRSPLNFGIDR
jgi:hypothetical protein